MIKGKGCNSGINKQAIVYDGNWYDFDMRFVWYVTDFTKKFKNLRGGQWESQVNR